MIDGEIKGEAWELKVTNGGEREEHFSVFGRTEPFGKKGRDVGRKGKSINTPLPSNGHLSHGSTSLQVRYCHTRQDSKSKGGVLAVLAVKLRM